MELNRLYSFIITTLSVCSLLPKPITRFRDLFQVSKLSFLLNLVLVYFRYLGCLCLLSFLVNICIKCLAYLLAKLESKIFKRSEIKYVTQNSTNNKMKIPTFAASNSPLNNKKEIKNLTLGTSNEGRGV